MKKRIFTAITIILCICFCFSGCDFTLLSAEELIRPPKISGEISSLQKAFESTVNKEFVQMKTPINGDDRSSYFILDIDRDGNDDGFVFYSDPSIDEFARVAVFRHDGNEWKSVSVLVGLAEEIYEVGFNDINGDGNYEVLISWTTLNPDSASNETLTLIGSRILTLYKFNNSAMTLLRTENFTKMYVSDFNGDGADDIFLSTVRISNDSNRTRGRIVTFNKDCSVNLDESFSLIGMLDIVSIISDSVKLHGEQYTRIYVDGVLSDAAFVTDVVECSNSDGKLSFPLHSEESGELPVTARSSKIYSFDINFDGKIEVPTLMELPFSKRIDENSEQEDNTLNLVIWSNLNGQDFVPVFKTLYNKSDNYYFIFEDDWVSKITAVYNANSSSLVFYSVKNGVIADKLFSIMTFSKSDWNSDNYDYDLLFDSDAYVYGYKYEQNDFISKQTVKDNFVTIS